MKANLKLFLKYPQQTLAVRNLGYNLDILFHDSHVAIFPDIGIVFNRIKKSGNTTVSAFFTEISEKPHERDFKKFKTKIIKPNSSTPKELRNLPSLYSVVVVRNPFSRILSGFLQKVSSGSNLKYREFGGFGKMTVEGFNEFLVSLENGKLHKNRHFWPQVDLLYQPIERFDYIAKLEYLVNDIRNILSEVGKDPMLANSLVQPHRVEAGTAKITSASTKLNNYYDEHSTEVVRRIYAADFLAFNYPMTLDPK